MQHNIDAAKMTLGLILSSTASMVGASASAVAITDQLSQTRPFLYLNLPIWVFFCAVLLLSMIGAIASLFTDIYANKDSLRPPVTHQLLHIFGGFISGIVGAFVVLPAVTSAENPSIEVMLVTALVLSFSGVVLINNLGDVKRDKALQQSIRKLLVARLSLIADLLSGNTKGKGE
ncbi:hypothetical protein [Psychrobacter sanguinis]|uniref:hypothetical protein n=1 Tax=Psychrobacter sanguinis TaxID=861445 RepID=UPI001917C074|nr:hypothetical protein [Psychrobacter sanguinis]MCC3344500.1 hypothetical protein [Psychrobacter sanguinis]